MNVLNIEIKARCENPEQIRVKLAARKARFIGTDHQVDTYFRVANGRLKLREGKIETNLIYYRREDSTTPKSSDVHLYRPADTAGLKALLMAVHGVLCVVDKQREIYFLDNVKIHLDQLDGHGSFLEIEAIDSDGSRNRKRLENQCSELMGYFEIQSRDLVSGSYSDMIPSKSG